MKINGNGSTPVKAAKQGQTLGNGGHTTTSAATASASASSLLRAKIRVMIVDDHPVVRKGIGSFLARQPNIEVVGEAGDGMEALRVIRDLSPDIILMDIDMPQMNGFVLADTIRKEHPHVKILILTVHSNSEYVLRIISCGARGYVLKNASPEDLINAIGQVYSGDAFFSPDVARIALSQFVRGSSGSPGCASLTPREKEVLIAIAEGMSNKEIACHLNVGVRTVETHRERIMRKLNIHSIAGLTKYAIARGLITIGREWELVNSR